jgi:hypothetical protein
MFAGLVIEAPGGLDDLHQGKRLERRPFAKLKARLCRFAVAVIHAPDVLGMKDVADRFCVGMPGDAVPCRIDGQGGNVRIIAHEGTHKVCSCYVLRPRSSGPYGATNRRLDGLYAHRPHRAAGVRCNGKNGRFTPWKNIICESRFSRCGGRLRR